MCDISTGVLRPYIPQQFRHTVSDSLHSLSHPSICATQHLITSQYVWPNINKDVRKWTTCCIQCQKSKIQRHTTPPLGKYKTPDARFANIHIDIVGPLPPYRGCVYLLTCIERFTKWPEAIPIVDMTADSCPCLHKLLGIQIWRAILFYHWLLTPIWICTMAAINGIARL